MDIPTPLLDWRTVLREQGRTIAWLADRTGRSRRTVYAYSQGRLPSPPEWIDEVSEALGTPVAETLVVTVTKQFSDGSAA